MRLNEINYKATILNAGQVQQLLLLIAKYARLKKREQTTGFNPTST